VITNLFRIQNEVILETLFPDEVIKTTYFAPHHEDGEETLSDCQLVSSHRNGQWVTINLGWSPTSGYVCSFLVGCSQIDFKRFDPNQIAECIYQLLSNEELLANVEKWHSKFFVEVQDPSGNFTFITPRGEDAGYTIMGQIPPKVLRAHGTTEHTVDVSVLGRGSYQSAETGEIPLAMNSLGDSFDSFAQALAQVADAFRGSPSESQRAVGDFLRDWEHGSEEEDS